MISPVHVLSFYLHPDSLVFQPVDVTVCYVVDVPVDLHHGGHNRSPCNIFTQFTKHISYEYVSKYTKKTIQMNLDIFLYSLYPFQLETVYNSFKKHKNLRLKLNTCLPSDILVICKGGEGRSELYVEIRRNIC